MKSKSKALRGYTKRDAISHRKYNFKTSVRRFGKSGIFLNKGNGSGHIAGEKWAEAKHIDPDSEGEKYSKNSPSFDEGVYQYKQSAKSKALLGKISPYGKQLTT